MSVHRTRDAFIGVVYLVVIAALVLLSVAIYQKKFTDYVEVTARTSSVGSSLQSGSDVKVRGILVGQVSDVSTSGKGARIELQLDPDKVASVPRNVLVQLLPKTLFGERYVNLALPADPDGRLGDGDTIAQDTSPQTVELEKLFADLLPVLTAVQPDKLAATLGEVAAALRGRGTDLGETLKVVGGYLDGLAPQVPQITDDLERLASVADTYNTAAPDLLTGLQALTTTSRTLVKQRQDYTNLLSSLTRTGRTFGEFVGTNSDQIINLSADSRPSLKLVAGYASEFPCISRALVDFIPRVDKAFGAGSTRPGARVVLHVIKPSTPYRAGDEPRFSATGGPRCPYTPATSLASTALADIPGVTGADTRAQRLSPKVAGIGTANSPQENQLIAELVAPATGLKPSEFPKWSSLVLGPALRGAEVTVR